jgi:hypothetical protein
LQLLKLFCIFYKIIIENNTYKRMIKLKEIYTEMAMKAILAGQLSKAHF